MIKYFKKHKLKNDIVHLEKIILTVLQRKMPSLIENHKNYKIITVVGTIKQSVTILHEAINLKNTIHKKTNQGNNFKIVGIEIFNKNKDKFVPFSLFVSNNLIQDITLPIEPYDKAHYDFNKITIQNISISILKFKNPDIETLRKILKNIDGKQCDLLELNDTFEIEVDTKFYYTIFDMEDGNYIAVNKLGEVFRLIHDHDNYAKKIFNNVKLLLNTYNGDKLTLGKYFED